MGPCPAEWYTKRRVLAAVLVTRVVARLSLGVSGQVLLPHGPTVAVLTHNVADSPLVHTEALPILVSTSTFTAGPALRLLGSCAS